MAKIIENPKTYTGQELDTVFFRPMLTGPNAEQLGVRIMYNLPVPTVLHFWKRDPEILQQYAKGWNGGAGAKKCRNRSTCSK